MTVSRTPRLALVTAICALGAQAALAGAAIKPTNASARSATHVVMIRISATGPSTSMLDEPRTDPPFTNDVNADAALAWLHNRP